MKNLSLSVFLFLFFARIGSSQTTVPIPDAGFLKCLKERYGSTVNSSNQLIKAEAAKFPDNILKCPSYGIESVQGLQYFTGVDNIVLQDNRINYMPDISGITKLKYLDLAENKLDHLPDLTKFPSLRSLIVDRNQIKVAPDLSGNDSLIEINFTSNQLDTLSDLSQMKQLKVLSVQYNNLKYMPNLEKLTSLEFLNAWKNQLVELPSLNALTKLKYVNVSYNALSTVPSLGSKPFLDTLYLNDNKISVLTDFLKCTALKKVRLYNNPLTFKEIQKITTVPKYDTIFKFNPQQPLQVGRPVQVREGDSLLLSTGLDRGVPNVVYKWYKNGTLVDSSTFDTLLLPKSVLADGGIYTCTLKKSGFSVVLSTNEFPVSVSKCVDLKKVYVSTKEINCLNEGAVAVTGEGLARVQSYELTSKASGKKHRSTDGKFNGLSETSYSLVLKVDNGCSKDTLVVLSQKDCEEVIMSPDGDGISDTFYFDEIGKVSIYDKRGQLIKTLSIPGEWDGSSEKGKVFSGFYVADVNNGKKFVGITVLY